jgi:hypothetical protein
MKESNKDFTYKISAERNGDCKIRKLAECTDQTRSQMVI